MHDFRVEAPFAGPVRGLSALVHDAAPCPPRWLKQVHGAGVLHLDEWRAGVEADAAWTDVPGQVAAVRTADCVPILLADPECRYVAAIHAGWRGLAKGVIARTVDALPAAPATSRAWIGPCIRQPSYEVGRDVRDALSNFETAFAPGRPGHWMADLAAIAARQLVDAGVVSIDDCGLCTATDPRLPSHRRDGSKTRLATMIWIECDRPGMPHPG